MNNNELRKEIAWMTYHAQEGHIPSAYSIVDIIEFLYDNVLEFDVNNPKWEERDYFILSKGHGCAALWAVLKKHGFITQMDLEEKNTERGILATHPDMIKVPGVEASTGSLGTGIGMALGIALGLRALEKSNKVICLIGDGESNEGTIWESAMVAAKYELGNFCVIADHNGSADVVLPVSNPEDKWRSFGWNVYSIDGHDMSQFSEAINNIKFQDDKTPSVIISHSKKGKGVSFIEENFGAWHSRIPDDKEIKAIYRELNKGEI